MVVGYLLVLATLLFALHQLHRGGAGPRRPTMRSVTSHSGQVDEGTVAGTGREPVWTRGWPAVIRCTVRDIVIGYALLMVVVVTYYYGIAKVGDNFLYSAFTGTALLVGLAAPVFAAASWLTTRRHRHADTSQDGQTRAGADPVTDRNEESATR